MSDTASVEEAAAASQDSVVSPLAMIYGQPLAQFPRDLYIPPDAMAVMLDAFEGPLDLLLYLIRKANVNVLDIPMALLTEQYLVYVEAMRSQNLELAADYLVMAAMLIEIKSRMLLPRPKAATGDDAEDPRAELVRRLIEYEQMKLAAQQINEWPQAERDFDWVEVWVEKALLRRLPTTGDASNGESESMVFGQFRISQSTRTASLNGHTIDLTTAEFDLLWLLASHAGNVLSRDDLLQELRGIGFDGLDRSIDARISRLRKKLNDDPENPTRIKTVRGKGYLFSKHDWN